jgi:hypothetical protein
MFPGNLKKKENPSRMEHPRTHPYSTLTTSSCPERSSEMGFSKGSQAPEFITREKEEEK